VNHSESDQVHLLSVTEAASRIRDGSLKPPEYVEALADRARRLASTFPGPGVERN